MMILRSSPPSPFGRKVEVAASVVGLAKEIEVVAADTGDPNEILRRQNLLGKIPVLVLEDGTTIFDSRVIVEYLDMRVGGDVLIPAEPKARVKDYRPPFWPTAFSTRLCCRSMSSVFARRKPVRRNG
jgi:glutathione S-transferase